MIYECGIVSLSAMNEHGLDNNFLFPFVRLIFMNHKCKKRWFDFSENEWLIGFHMRKCVIIKSHSNVKFLGWYVIILVKFVDEWIWMGHIHNEWISTNFCLVNIRF